MRAVQGGRTPGVTTCRGVLLVLAALLAGCGVLELGGSEHEAVALEPAAAVGDDVQVLVELLATDVAGETVVELHASRDELRCRDGEVLAPEGLAAGTELRFEREGSDQPVQEPPSVRARALQVDCDA